MLEPPDASENPFVRIQIADNEIDLDPSDNGSLINDITLEVRADDAGKIRVGPLGINVQLEDAKQKVEVTFQATDKNGAELPQFPPQKFIWNDTDQDTPRFWGVFTSDLNVGSYYKYQVRVIVKGSLMTKGMEWTGPWVRSVGNGPSIISVPAMDDPDVVVKRDVDKLKPSTSKPTPPPSVPGTKGIVTNGQGEADYSYAIENESSSLSHVPPSSRPATKKGAKAATLQNGTWTIV